MPAGTGAECLLTDNRRITSGVKVSSNYSEDLFLNQRPPFSKSQVNKQGSLWRDGLGYDIVSIEEFIAFNAVHVEKLLAITKQVISSFIIDLNPNDGPEILPDSNAYNLAARVKTRGTLLEKLRRMGKTPLMNIQDVAGLRFDCDLSLTEQMSVAKAFASGFESHGATRVDIKDFRSSPHSGYRAVHLHIRAAAGRSEMQIRTALQSKWANLYEEAADILGREIRYLHESAKVPVGAEELVGELHRASMLVRDVEVLSDHAGGVNFGEVRERRRQVYGILERIHDELKCIRSRTMNEKGE